MKGKNYRVPRGMPTTRKDYLPGIPNPKIAKFTMGDPSGDYDVKLELVSNERAQIRHNALEAARIATNKKLANLDVSPYLLKIKIYPHVILRENKMIATAGADRLQEGMRKAYGKPVGLAARVERGTVIMEVCVKKEHVGKAKEALKGGASKLPTPTTIREVQLKELLAKS